MALFVGYKHRIGRIGLKGLGVVRDVLNQRIMRRTGSIKLKIASGKDKLELFRDCL